MKKILLITTLGGLLGMSACSEDSGQAPLPAPETTVRLEGAIGLSTRAVIGSGYDKELEVCFARRDETAVSSAAYGPWSLCKATRSSGKGNRPILFADLQLYPVDGRMICLHGYYPVGGDVVAFDKTTGTVVFTADGETDLMATGIITGDTYAPVKTCTFRHLLTQIQLICYSDRTDQWGSVTKIVAVDVHTKLRLDLSSASPALTAVASEGAIKSLAAANLVEFPIPQTADVDPQGVFLLPGQPSESPLRLQITTTKDGRGNVAATVSDLSVSVTGGFQTGKRHVISLFFTDGSRISTTAVGVEAWTEQEEGDIPI